MRSPMAIALMFLFAGAARADTLYFEWSSVAAGCVPGDPAIQLDRYLISGGSVKHTDNAAGLITLYCPIHQISNACDFLNGSPVNCRPNVLQLTYRDSDGTRSGVNLTAQLVRVNQADGSVSFVPGAFLDTNTNSSTGNGYLVTSPFTETFAMKDSYYYVRVDLNRAVGSKDVAIFYGVALFSNIKD